MKKVTLIKKAKKTLNERWKQYDAEYDEASEFSRSQMEEGIVIAQTRVDRLVKGSLDVDLND